MAKLNLDRQESDFLNNVITRWVKDDLLSDEQAEKLKSSYEVRGFDWMRLAKYSFWIALACGAIAFAYLLIDQTVLNWIKKLYYTPDIVIGIGSGALAAGLYFLGHRNKTRYPEKVFSNEAMIFTGIFFTAC